MPKALQDGWAAVERVIAAGTKSQRERDYIATVEAFHGTPTRPTTGPARVACKPPELKRTVESLRRKPGASTSAAI